MGTLSKMKGGDVEVLAIEHQNVKDRFSEQHETLREFSQEGMNIFRLVILFVAAPAAILGALSPENLQQLGELLLSNECAIRNGSTCIPIHFITFMSGLLLVLAVSVNVAASGYESRAIHNYTNPEDVILTIESNFLMQEYYNNRLIESVDRLDHNERVIMVMEQFLAFGKVFLYLSIFTITTLVYVILSDSPIPLIRWAGLLFLYLLPIVYYMRELPQEYLRADNATTLPLYDREKVVDYTNSQINEKKETVDSKPD